MSVIIGQVPAQLVKIKSAIQICPSRSPSVTLRPLRSTSEKSGITPNSFNSTVLVSSTTVATPIPESMITIAASEDQCGRRATFHFLPSLAFVGYHQCHAEHRNGEHGNDDHGNTGSRSSHRGILLGAIHAPSRGRNTVGHRV